MAPDPPKSSYLKTQVMTASPAQLRLLLLDGAIKFAERGRDGLARKDFEASYEGISRCRDILTELINSLRPEHDPELCGKLSALYTYLYTRLLDATSTRTPEPVDEVLELLRYERETWSLLLEKLAAENAGASRLDATPEVSEAPPNAARGRADTPLLGGKVSLKG